MGTTWSRQRVIDEIRQWHARGVPVKSIWRQSRTLVAAACAYHGSWRAALQAAGLESERQLWSQERVIRELRERYSAPGTPSRWVDADSRLRAAAKRYFGSWHQALVAAGLRKAAPRQLRSWTRDEVLQAIRMRPQDDSGVQTPWRSDPRLYSVAKRVFGSWRKALLAAGCEVQTPRPWTRDEVLCEIHTRHAEGQPLTRISRSDPPLYRGAKRHFGNWRNALQAAGIATRPSHSWTKAIITESLRRRHAEGPPLSHVWKDDKPLFCAAIRKFGNWHTALRAAGIEPRPFRKWSPERVIDGLCAQYRHAPCVIRRVDPALAGAAYRLFGSVALALDAAGLDPPPGRWTPGRVIEQIQDGHVQGRPLHKAGLGDKRLAAAAKRYFGHWRTAVAAAGLAAQLPPATKTRVWSPQAVIEEILDWHRRGYRLTELWKRDTGLYSAAKKHYGSWQAAVRAAGLETTRRQWTPEIVIRELQARHAGGRSMTSGAVCRDDSRLGAAALRLFGRWPAALAAAGIPRPGPHSATRKPRRRKRACSAKK